MREKWILFAAVVAGLVLLGLGIRVGQCPLWLAPSAVQEPEGVEFGALLPLSGDAATYGENARKAIDLAVGEINDAGGIRGARIRVVYMDTQAAPNAGVAAFEELTEDPSISAVIGPMSSSVTLAVAPLAEAEHVVLLSPSASSPEITTAGEYVFRTCLSDQYEGLVLARLAADTLGYQTAAALYIDNEYGRGLVDVFSAAYETAGGTMVTREAFPEDATEFAAPLERIAEAAPQVILLVGYAQMGDVLVEARAAGLTQQVLGSVMFDNPEILAAAGEAAEGVLFTSWAPDPATPSPARQTFDAGYQARYGVGPGIFAAESYDATYLLARAIEGHGDTGDAIRVGLHDIADYPGASGSITFDENGDCIKPVFIKTVRDGAFVYTSY
jgi:branched-chain amino acid transport system substrate-binding protein